MPLTLTDLKWNCFCVCYCIEKDKRLDKFTVTVSRVKGESAVQGVH